MYTTVTTSVFTSHTPWTLLSNIGVFIGHVLWILLPELFFFFGQFLEFISEDDILTDLKLDRFCCKRF